MKLLFEIELAKNQDQVWKAFDNTENLKKWQPSLKSFEHQTGEPGQVGATSKLVYDEDGREIHMTETITKRDEPNELSGMFDTEGASNTMVNKFVVIDENTTRWLVDCEFEFSGAFKIFSPLIKKSIKKRMNNDMGRFKELLENGMI